MRPTFWIERLRLLGLSCLALASATTVVEAQDSYNVFFSSNSASGVPGGTVTVSIQAQNRPEAITGFSLGVMHDASLIESPAVELGAAVTAALAGTDPDERFFTVNTEPQGGAGFTAAMILSFDDAAVTIPAGDESELLTVTYNVVGDAGATGTIALTDSLGSPAVGIVLDVQGGVSKPVTPSGDNASVSVEILDTSGAAFRRGDVDQTGRLSIIDAQAILRFQFFGLETPASANCLVSYNADGSMGRDVPDQEDELDVDLTDGIFVLNTLFLQGPLPPAPFPACGKTPTLTSERMRCVEFGCP